jgi:integrase
VYLAATTALRRGELCGLRRTDLRLDDTPPELTVTHNVVEAAGRVTVKDPKSHARRRLALDPETVSLLRRHHARSVEQALAFGLRLDDNGYVFSDDPAGREPTKPGSLSTRLRAAVKAAGLTKIGFHSLRHYSLSTLISEGIDPRTAAGRAGHRDSSVTLRTYAHVVRASDEAAVT